MLFVCFLFFKAVIGVRARYWVCYCAGPAKLLTVKAMFSIIAQCTFFSLSKRWGLGTCTGVTSYMLKKYHVRPFYLCYLTDIL